MRKSCFLVVLAAFLFAALSTPLVAAIIVPGADGSDGAFNPTESVEIDLAQAVTGTWNQVGTGKGVYDATKWAVVFKYSSVNIPDGVIVTFKNHPSGAPVVWLVQGDANVAGTVSVSSTSNAPGPGGFCNGRGPGTNYSTDYGNITVMPLMGGSGYAPFGLHGGGALLLAATGTIKIAGQGCIRTGAGWGMNNGYPPHLPGGGLRLICDNLEYEDARRIDASGYCNGRIRVETNGIIPVAVPGLPAASVATVGTTAQIWPEDTAPRIKCVSIAGASVPSDPKPTLLAPDVYFAGAATRTLVIQTENVPLNWHVRARLGGDAGTKLDYEATYKSGDLASSTWEVEIPLAAGYSAIQARASVN